MPDDVVYQRCAGFTGKKLLAFPAVPPRAWRNAVGDTPRRRHLAIERASARILAHRDKLMPVM